MGVAKIRVIGDAAETAEAVEVIVVKDAVVQGLEAIEEASSVAVAQVRAAVLVVSSRVDHVVLAARGVVLAVIAEVAIPADLRVVSGRVVVSAEDDPAVALEAEDLAAGPDRPVGLRRVVRDREVAVSVVFLAEVVVNDPDHHLATNLA